MILFYILFAALVKLKETQKQRKQKTKLKTKKKTKKSKKHKGNSVNSENDNVLNNPMQVKAPSQVLRVKSYTNNKYNKTTNTNTTATITKSVHST